MSGDDATCPGCGRPAFTVAIGGRCECSRTDLNATIAALQSELYRLNDLLDFTATKRHEAEAERDDLRVQADTYLNERDEADALCDRYQQALEEIACGSTKCIEPCGQAQRALNRQEHLTGPDRRLT